MKFITKIAFVVILLLGINLSSCFILRANTSKNLLSFANSFTHELQANLLKMGSGSGAKASSSGSSPSGAAVPDGKPIQDWMYIRDVIFQETAKFPPLLLPDGTEVRIDADKESFRLNPLYKKANADPNLPSKSREFWFSVTDKFITYTVSKTDNNIIGALDYNDITGFEPESQVNTMDFCFSIKTKRFHNHRWTICTDTEQKWLNFLCKIQIKSNWSEKYGRCQTIELGIIPPISIVEKTYKPIIVVPIAAKKCNEKWNYKLLGQDWECTCSEGREQSPIDLPPQEEVTDSPVAPLFKFNIASARAEYSSMEKMIKKNEYIKLRYYENALRILHPDLGYISTLDGARYVAQEIVFHTPAEHTIAGVRYDMEVQIICFGETKGDIEKQVTLSVLFQKKSGHYNKFIDDLDYFTLPNIEQNAKDIVNDLDINKLFYESSDDSISILKPFDFYTYQGSLTSPPCSERTIVFVAAKPLPLANVTLQLFKEAIKERDLLNEYGQTEKEADEVENYRAIQPRNNRKIFYFDSSKYCEQNSKPVSLPQTGHYEKIPMKADEYIYVPSKSPSGIPDSFLVSKTEALMLNPEEKAK